jgi:Concanavalin A-like lectin/glucanases superfamily
MKRLGICFGISGLLLGAACSSDPAPATGGSAGTGGSSAGATSAGNSAGGSVSGATSAGAGGGGMVTAGATSGGAGSGGTAGAGTAGAGGAGTAGTGGAAGAAGTGGAGTCDIKVGKAIKFAEKTNDMVAGDLMAEGTLGDKPRTLELWAKFAGANSWTAEQSIIELGKPGAPDDGNNVFGIDMSGRKDATTGVFGPYTHGCSDNNGTGAPPAFTAPVGIGWLHLSWSYNPANADKTKRLEFTVNGDVLPTEFDAAKYTKTGDKLVGNTGFVLLGASQNFGNAGWDGVMDEVRIWTVYRTPAEVKANMNVIVKPTTPGLLAYYQFNEADAANVKDSTGSAAHTLKACTAAGGACPGANAAAPTFVDSDIPGAFTCGQ